MANLQSIENYIGGNFLASTRWLNNVEPATGQVYSRVPDSTAADLEQAVAAAAKAFPSWASFDETKRAQILLTIADLIEGMTEEFAFAESVDAGKPVSLAKSVDIPRAVANFRFFAHAVTQAGGSAFATGAHAINYTLHDPLGVVACISPWNLPLYLLTWKIAPALATGNCVIAKPSELTPMTAFLLCKICAKAGLPAGVLSMVHGRGADIGAALVEHPQVRAISFTGGTTTGASIARAAAPQFKRTSLELGGKNPCLVFADVDLDKIVEEVLRSAFFNQGQICLGTSRLYVEESIYDSFVQRFLDRARALVVGDPLAPETRVGALISQDHLSKVLSHIELAQKEGGTILCGGRQVKLKGRCSEGFFVEPTVVSGLAPESRTNQEEIFGPVVTVQSFKTEDEAIRLANNSAYGLSASIWSRDGSRCHRVARSITAGVVWINSWLLRDLRTPFGGMKNSGIGREGGAEILRFFTETKNVCIRYDG